MSNPIKAPLYGKNSDTGDLSIRAAASFKMDGGIMDPTMCCLAVEIWSTRPFGPEQNRAHCTEQYIVMPVTEDLYQKAYADLLATYEAYWKQWGAETPSDWKHGLAVACGEAMGKFMSSELVKSALTLH